MLWDSKTVLRRRDKSEVEFSEVVGKRIILLIGISWVRVAADSLSILKSKYSMLKDTDDDFEAHISYHCYFLLRTVLCLLPSIPMDKLLGGQLLHALKSE
ncbi:uncharacterized protein LOC141723984 isoform X2 [Apium graveolens]|uniref:uncharacterized protein LOC141723984 isoform X2 n=1 Tax=Apium graveolens TaxID=4045 RepID=UPI003D793032